MSVGLVNTMKELNSARADDTVMKQEMLRDIALNGSVRLSDLTDDIGNKTALNATDVYFLGMGLKTDLVTKGLMTYKTLSKSL
jgi:hypothetical protein